MLTLLTLLTLIVNTVVNKTPTSAGYPQTLPYVGYLVLITFSTALT